MTRDKFEELAAPVLERVRKPVMQALETAGMSAADVSTVEMCGAASRTPAMVKTVADVFGQEPKRCGPHFIGSLPPPTASSQWGSRC